MPELDIATLHACQQGDRAAFRRLYDVYAGRIYALALRFSGDAEEAHDLAQEVFLRAFQAIDRFQGECALGTWLYRIACNAALDRRSRRRPEPVDDETLAAYPDPAPLPQAQAEGRELAVRLEQAIAALPAPLRLPFILAAVERRPYAEVAALLGLRVEAVRMRVSRARKLLRTELDPRLY